MIKRIGKHLSDLLLFQFILITIGCSSNKTPIKVARNEKEMELFGENKTVTLLLAREICDNGSFNFCSDGHEQPYRLYPLFLKINSENIFPPYDTIFMFPTDEVLNQIKQKGIIVSDAMTLDLMFENNSGREISFDNPDFCTKVKSYYKNNKINQVVGCKFRYQIYRINATIISGGKKQIILPDFSNNKNLIKDHLAEVFYLTSIDHVTPVN